MHEAVAALARHVCLKAPDKAEFRVAAVEAASALMAQLHQDAQEQFVGFAYQLSKSPVVRPVCVCGCMWGGGW